MAPELLIALALTAADTAQTEWITRHDQHCTRHEENPLLGQHPSQIKVAGYMGGSMGALYGLNQVLPAKQAQILNYVWIGAEGSVVAHNLRIGIRFSF